MVIVVADALHLSVDANLDTVSDTMVLDASAYMGSPGPCSLKLIRVCGRRRPYMRVTLARHPISLKPLNPRLDYSLFLSQNNLN